MEFGALSSGPLFSEIPVAFQDCGSAPGAG